MTRIRILKFIFLTFALLIIGRGAQLLVAPDPRLARQADRQFSTKITALPRRGLVFDRNGDGMAISLKVRSLFFRPEIIRRELTRAEKDRVIFNIAKILKTNVSAIAAKASSDKGFVWVKRQLTDAEEDLVRRRGLLEYGEAVGLVEESKRFYPNKDLAAHVLGSVNVDGQGLEGLELYYDALLRGEHTRLSSSKDAMGRRIFRDDKGLLAFKDGQSLVLTLDSAIQYEIEKVLAQSISEYRAKAGTIIVAEVASGEILAMANYPTFNPNSPKGVLADSRRNRAITDTYEPGSIFKPFVLAAAMERGKTPKSRVYCEKGSFVVADRRISEAEAHEKFEWLTLTEVLKFSSNIGAAKTALELGASAIDNLMSRLGVGKRTGIDLPGEVPGSLDRSALKSSVRIANIGFGHGFTVTPLQMLSYYLMLANGGNWIQPKLVKAVLAEDPDSLERGAVRWKLGKRLDTQNGRPVFNPRIANQINQMLETVVEEKGTGTKAALDEWKVAGKTATAQKVDSETRRYSHTKFIASFAGFAPAKNPKLVTLVVLDEPQKAYYAGETAAPTFREAMRAGLLRERVPVDGVLAQRKRLANRAAVDRVGAETPEQPALAKSVQLKSTQAKSLQAKPAIETPAPVSDVAENEDPSRVKLPDMKGMTVREAIRAIGSQPVKIEVVGNGVLKEQIPASDRWLEAGAHVRLIFREQE